jgi:hypothetical protein
LIALGLFFFSYLRYLERALHATFDGEEFKFVEDRLGRKKINTLITADLLAKRKRQFTRPRLESGCFVTITISSRVWSISVFSVYMLRTSFDSLKPSFAND